MSFLTKKISREKLDALVKPYQTDLKTLEIGARGAPSYATFFSHRVGVDIEAGPGVDVVASVYDLPFESESFDVVLCLSVLEHVEHPRDGIKEMRRVLKKGGTILVSVPFLFPIHDSPNDYWRFTKYGLRKLFIDWDIKVLQGESDIGTSFAILLQRVGFQTKLRLNRLTKASVFLAAKLVRHMGWFVTGVYGDIGKHVEEPDAFTSSFFLVAKKPLVEKDDSAQE